MKYMLDTNACIDLMRGKRIDPDAVRAVHGSDELRISSVVYAELMHGVFKSLDPQQSLISLLLMLAPISIVDFGAQAAAVYGDMRSKLESKGEVIGPLDMLIASHARAEGAVLVTNNVREFSRVEGLKIEDWTRLPEVS